MYSTTTKKLLSLLTAFAMVFSMIAVVQPMQASAATVEIPISNGDFENGAFGGAVNGSNGASIVEKATYEGNYALKFDATGEILTVTGYLAEATTAESTVTLSFWAKVLAGSTQNSVNFGLFATNESWGNRVQKYGAGCPIVGGDWKQISQALTVPAGTKIIQAQIYLGAAGATAIVDNISVTDGNGNELLQSGGFEKGALNGDFNANDALEIVCTPVHGGNYAAHADKSAGNGNISTTVSFEPSSEARTMEFSFWVYVPTGSTDSTSTMVACFDTSSGSWNNLSTKYGAQYARTFGQWVQKTMEIAVAANTNTLQIQLYAQDAGADFYIDDLKLTETVPDALPNTDLTVDFSYVNVDDTWYFTTDSTGGTNGYYKMPVLVDGVEQTVNMQRYAEGFRIWPNQFQNSVVPTSSLVIPAGTVMTSATETITVTEKLEVGYADGKWSKIIPNYDITVDFSHVQSDGAWQLIGDTSKATANHYKMNAIVDGAEQSVKLSRTANGFTIWANFFASAPVNRLVIPANTVLTAIDSTNHWAVIENAATLTITNVLDVSYVNGVWGKTVYTTDVTLELASVQNDGTWQFTISEAPANRFYKVPATIDGKVYNVLIGESKGLMCIYPDFFTALGGAVPDESVVIPAGTIMKPVVSDNGWKEIDTVNALKITNDVSIENNLGSWQDMSQYADVTFEEITADDLIVYKWEDQAESNYRSVLGIYAPDAQFGNDAGWGNFTKVAGKVLIDGVEVSAVYGMAPGADDDSSWGANNAILLYITGEGYWNAVTTASSVTVCAGTMLVSGVDNTKGVKFAEDFTMYKNCDGSWDTTAETHIYNQQNTELEGALVSEANCQSAATYYYSCSCGELGSETFTAGELGNHNYVNGSCTVCGKAAQNITVSLHAIAVDGTWQFDFSAAPARYYKIPAIIDGKECNVLIGEDQGLMCIYPNFFTALNGTVPAESFVIPAGTALKAVDSANGWAEIEDAAVLLVTEELKIENIAGKWVEMSKYSNVEFKEIYAADLDVYYQNIMRLGDYSDLEVQIALNQYPEYKPLFEIYGRNANMTTFGIKSTIPTLQIPNDANWANFTLLGTVSVNGASPAETYVMMTPDSSDDAETAMTSGFLVRFYNGFVADVATSVTIEPGTRIVTKDGTAGFVFVDGYTIYRDENGNWSDTVPAGVNPVNTWGLILGDNIGVKFQMNVNPEDAVTFTVNGNPVAAEQNGNLYTIYVAAAQMADDIVISINGVAQEKTYSVRQYADIILADDVYGELTKNLVKSMLVYGGAAQTYFNYNTGNLASNGIEVSAVAPNGDGTIDFTDNLSQLSFYGATLVHQNKTAVRFYFTGSMEGLTVTANGSTINANAKGDQYYVEVSGINPQALGDDVQIVVSNGTENLTVTYSPLDYMVRMYEKGNETTQALVQALYGYYMAAAEYAK